MLGQSAIVDISNDKRSQTASGVERRHDNMGSRPAWFSSTEAVTVGELCDKDRTP